MKTAAPAKYMDRQEWEGVQRKIRSKGLCPGKPFQGSVQLAPVFADEVFANVGFQLAVIGVDGGAKGRFG
jgi:hypothetical protein